MLEKRERGAEYEGLAKGIVNTFLAKNPQLKTKVKQEKIDIRNPEEVKKFIAAYARYSTGLFRRSIEHPEKFEHYQEGNLTAFPLLRKVLGITVPKDPKKPNGEKVPVTLAIDRYLSNDPRKGKNGNYAIRLIKGNFENQKFIPADPELEVCTFAMRDYGNEFRLSHRYLPPQYRGQKLGGMVLNGIEEFVREYAKQDPSRKPEIDVYAAQLDVLAFYDSHGYESIQDLPAEGTTENRLDKMYGLDEIMEFLEETNNGLADEENPKFKIGPLLYTFPGDFPEYQYFKNPSPKGGLTGRTKGVISGLAGILGIETRGYADVNINKSALVHFRKRLEPSDEILPVIPEEISEETRTKLVQNLMESTFLPDRKPDEEIRKRVNEALKTTMAMEEYDRKEIVELGEDNVGYSMKKNFLANKGRIADFLNQGRVIGTRDEYGNVVAIAAYKQHGKTADGRPIYEITKVSRLKEAGGKGYGQKAMADAVKYLRNLYPDAALSTASKTPGVIAYFEGLGWEKAPWGDMNNPLSVKLSGEEPVVDPNADEKTKKEQTDWQKEWRKMRETGYVNLYFDPKK